MKTMKKFNLFLVLPSFVFSFAQIARTGVEIGNGFVLDPRVGGIELGNGRIVENLEGQYQIFTPEKWEVGRNEKMLEIIAPLSEGVPRARLEIDVLPNTFNSALALEETLIAAGWEKARLRKLNGYIKINTVGGMFRRHEIDLQLIRNMEIIVIHMVGNKGRLNSLDRMLHWLGSFKDLFSESR